MNAMARTTHPPLPSVARLLAGLGENIRLARLRRGMSASRVAERAGMSRTTLHAIERGSPGTTLGSYASVIQVHGLHEDLALVRNGNYFFPPTTITSSHRDAAYVVA